MNGLGAKASILYRRKLIQVRIRPLSNLIIIQPLWKSSDLA